jgi:hypothetical protein
MHPNDDFSKIINRKRYSVATATLLAGDDFWDGHNYERSGRQCYLYRTPNGAYFEVNLTCWQGEQDTLLPIDQSEAIELYEGDLTEHRLSYQEAFSGVEVVDA